MNYSAKVLIIIVTWNKKQYVLDLLASLADMDYPDDNMDILVVDNASTDGTVEALRKQFGSVRLICNQENLGGTGGFNTGLAWAFAQDGSAYDYLWLLDNDVQVHRSALSALVAVLEQTPDAAVCGSTMMQLDYPWRINEMGAFVDRKTGALQLNRHLQEILSWKERNLAELRSLPVDLSRQLMYCQPCLDVDYVAAASLLVRAPVARAAGLWMDFFIHFDDVEWCLRIGEMGHRVLVSARSLIWHMSAMAKVPTWVLYYDNRNVLFLLEKYNRDRRVIVALMRFILKKALYYQLLGKKDIAQLHCQAVADYQQGVTGKKSINLADANQPLLDIERVLSEPDVKKILLPWTINLQATPLQAVLAKTLKRRDDFQLYALVPPFDLGTSVQYQVPGMIPIQVSRFFLLRYWQYFRLRKHFDVVLQSDYQSILALSWLAERVLFVNYETFSERKKPQVMETVKFCAGLLRQWLRC